MSFVEYLKPSRYGAYLPAIESALRTIFYLALSILLLVWGRRGSPIISGAITGFIVADYLTWLIITIQECFDYVTAGAWDAVVNIAASMAIFHFSKLEFPSDFEGAGAGFFCFLIVIAAKLAYYGAREMSEELSEG